MPVLLISVSTSPLAMLRLLEFDIRMTATSLSPETERGRQATIYYYFHYRGSATKSSRTRRSLPTSFLAREAFGSVVCVRVVSVMLPGLTNHGEPATPCALRALFG